MFVLWIGCVMQMLLLVKCQITVSTTRKMDPMTKLKHSLEYVILLLDDIDLRIFNQRRRISLLNGLRMGESANALADIVADGLRMGGSDNALADIVADLDARELDTVPEHFKVFLENYLFHKNSSFGFRTILSRSEKIPLKLQMNNIMANQKIGYCHAAMIGIIDMVINKEEHDSKIILQAFRTTIKRMLSEGQLKDLGDLLTKRVKLLWVFISLLPDNSIKENAYKVQQALMNSETLDDDIIEILNTYDTFFMANEGEKLLENMEKLYKYEARGDSQAVQPLVERLLESLLAPANRKRASIEFGGFITMINQACLKRYPNLLRSRVDTSKDIINTYHNNKINSLQRHKGKQNSKYDEEHKYRRIDIKKKHIQLHHNNYQQNNYHKPEEYDEKLYFKTEDTKKTIPTLYFRTRRPTLTYYASKITTPTLNSLHTKSTQRQLKIIPEFGKMTIPGLIKITNNTKNNKNPNSIYNTKSASYMNFETSTGTTNKLLYDNKILQNIVAESSYSDEEVYLKKKLNHAFIHSWNETHEIHKPKWLEKSHLI